MSNFDKLNEFLENHKGYRFFNLSDAKSEILYFLINEVKIPIKYDRLYQLFDLLDWDTQLKTFIRSLVSQVSSMNIEENENV